MFSIKKENPNVPFLDLFLIMGINNNGYDIIGKLDQPKKAYGDLDVYYYI